MTDKPKYYDDKSKVRTMRYQQEHRDRVTIWVQKGDREKYKKHAEKRGKSLNALVIELLEKDIANCK